MRFPMIIPALLAAVAIGAGATALARAADSDTIERIDLGATRKGS